MSNPHNPPWAGGDNLSEPGPPAANPAHGFGSPADPSSSSSYTNPVLRAPGAADPGPSDHRGWSEPGASEPGGWSEPGASEPGGWSEPQTFGAAPPAATPAPLQFGQRLPYNYGAAPAPEHPNATLVLVLGIVGLFTNLFFVPFVSPIAWYLGAKARREMASHPGVYSDSGKLTAGFVLGIIGTLFALLGVAFFVILILLATGIGR